jgi:hypothetical protein
MIVYDLFVYLFEREKVVLFLVFFLGGFFNANPDFEPRNPDPDHQNCLRIMDLDLNPHLMSCVFNPDF